MSTHLKKKLSAKKLEDNSHLPLIKDPHFYSYKMIIWKKCIAEIIAEKLLYDS